MYDVYTINHHASTGTIEDSRTHSVLRVSRRKALVRWIARCVNDAGHNRPEHQNNSTSHYSSLHGPSVTDASEQSTVTVFLRKQKAKILDLLSSKYQVSKSFLQSCIPWGQYADDESEKGDMAPTSGRAMNERQTFIVELNDEFNDEEIPEIQHEHRDEQGFTQTSGLTKHETSESADNQKSLSKYESGLLEYRQGGNPTEEVAAINYARDEGSHL